MRAHEADEIRPAPAWSSLTPSSTVKPAAAPCAAQHEPFGEERIGDVGNGEPMSDDTLFRPLAMALGA
jgi:hypothetical protein